MINFLSIVWPPLANASAMSILVIEPNNFSPPALANILISIAFKASPNAFASATTLASLWALCFKFSANTFFADEVANWANPCGIK